MLLDFSCKHDFTNQNKREWNSYSSAYKWKGVEHNASEEGALVNRELNDPCAMAWLNLKWLRFLIELKNVVLMLTYVIVDIKMFKGVLVY